MHRDGVITIYWAQGNSTRVIQPVTQNWVIDHEFFYALFLYKFYTAHSRGNGNIDSPIVLMIGYAYIYVLFCA